MSDDDLEGRAARLLEHPAVAAARRHLEEDDARTLADQAELTRIPAPPHGEGPRGEEFARRLEEAGASDPRVDEVGNVLATVPGTGAGSAVAVAAHLDTVFPPEAGIAVVEEGDLLRGPGISDNGRGLAALLALVRALRAAEVPLTAPLLVVGTVGEEGEGDLRGVRHLFRERGPGWDLRAFVSLDGAGMRRVVHRGLGSTRLRITVRGPGGHSWTDYGTANPVHALATAIGEMAGRGRSSEPLVTFTAARWGGGHAVNAIPREAWVEVDLRSESGPGLTTTERELRRRVEAALAAENSGRKRRSEALTHEISDIGRRPAGATGADDALVRAACAATAALGTRPELVASSTDSNIPMSLGVPAVTLGAGGEAGGAHTPDEWYRNEKGPEGILRALLTLALLGGIEEE